ESEQLCLMRDCTPGGASIETMAVRQLRLAGTGRDEMRFRDKNDERGGGLCPALIEIGQDRENPLPFRRLAQGIDEAPRLRVEGRRRPAAGLENGEDVCFGDGFGGEGARGPT